MRTIRRKEKTMRKILISVAMSAAMMTTSSGAKAQVDLSAYADAEGFLDIQALTCAQLPAPGRIRPTC
jgi:uncharacterized protein (UPF0303 family)